MTSLCLMILSDFFMLNFQALCAAEHIQFPWLLWRTIQGLSYSSISHSCQSRGTSTAAMYVADIWLSSSISAWCRWNGCLWTRLCVSGSFVIWNGPLVNWLNRLHYPYIVGTNFIEIRELFKGLIAVEREREYFVVSTCNITLFSHVIIRIDHGRSATTPVWFVVRRRDVPRAQLLASIVTSSDASLLNDGSCSFTHPVAKGRSARRTSSGT